ncbi:endonuclease/exonuclease/phosphatase family protein [Streptomyces sp. ID05-04B]|uniref:jacalin-like lectin n=1 Tax=unclassified Streptomyces TaxID=2593676 RepID=UPI000D1B58D6|nr:MULTISPECIES: endonuclease/exonuclease/phosphatase family protein [unclassified Streptomyces]MDX5569946.1 endonuclease/exonuclease/phosphatase family protein [Streptomyces sp. ID05-04B]
MRRLLTCLTAAAITCGGFAATATPAAAADPASGSFSTLTYNVAGLPAIISSASTPRDTSTTAIGQRIAPYDIVHVEEDFNYHSYLYAADTAHAYRTPTSGGAGIGSGLNTLSKLPYDTDDFERVRWNSCQVDSGDCLTPKGFTFVRERLAEGVYVDFYNLHTNAGTNDGDLASRADNLAQLTAFIKTHSAGNAVVVMGDTNTRYTRSGDTIAEFAAENGLTDAWVKLVRGGTPPAKGSDALVCDQSGPTVPNTCEVVDKVLYRGSGLVTLNATSYNNEHTKFLTGDGLMLSDHDPVAVGFSWSRNPDFQLSDQFGGPHGDYYNDIDAVPAGASPVSLSLRSGSRVDGVALTLAGGKVLAHGGTGGTVSTLTLGSGEYVTSAQLCQGRKDGLTRVFSAKFITNLGRSLSGGTTTSDCVTRTAPSGWQLAGFHGRAGGEIDKLGFIYTKR